MGTLADELDSESDWDEGVDEIATPLQLQSTGKGYQTPASFRGRLGSAVCSRQNATRDSGVDIGYSPSPSQVKYIKSHTSHPHEIGHSCLALSERPSSVGEFSDDLEEFIRDVADLAKNDAYTLDAERPWYDYLEPQAELEAKIRTYRTSLTTVSECLLQHVKTLVSLSSSLGLTGYQSFSLSDLSPLTDRETIGGLLNDVLCALPIPDLLPIDELIQLGRVGSDLHEDLSALLDALQMNRQAATDAARNLRSVQQMTSELLRGYQAADHGQEWIESGQWDHKLRSRWCAVECREVISEFDKTCDGLRRGFEEGLIV